MKKGQKSVRGGIEDFLFPMETVKITQGDNVGTHKGTYAIDLAGVDTGKDLAYFPFTAKCVAVDSKNGNAVVWESTNPVRFADGSIDIARLMVIHDNSLSGISVGVVYPQGVQMAQEGTAGQATGNHLHIEVGKGKHNGTMYAKNSYGVYHMPNNMPIEKACFIDDTQILTPGDPWVMLADVPVNEGVTPPVENGKTLTLLPTNANGEAVTSWRVYDVSTGVEKAKLNPSQYGGLVYPIEADLGGGWYQITTDMFGTVKIYAGAETPSKIS